MVVEAIHLSYIKYIFFLAGCYQYEKLTNKCYQILYILFKYWIDGFFALNWLMLILALCKYVDNTQILSETTSYVLLYWIVYVINSQVRSSRVTRIFVNMEKEELVFLKNANSDVLKILKYYANLNNEFTRSIFWIVAVFCLYYVISRRFLSDKPVYYQYYPIDTERFMIIEYITQSIFLAICDIYFVFSKVSVTTLLMYILFRLKSIQYFLRNSEKLSNVLKEKYKISLDDARYCVIKSIIKEHSLVIE